MPTAHLKRHGNNNNQAGDCSALPSLSLFYTCLLFAVPDNRTGPLTWTAAATPHASAARRGHFCYSTVPSDYHACWPFADLDGCHNALLYHDVCLLSSLHTPCLCPTTYRTATHMWFPTPHLLYTYLFMDYRCTLPHLPSYLGTMPPCACYISAHGTILPLLDPAWLGHFTMHDMSPHVPSYPSGDPTHLTTTTSHLPSPATLMKNILVDHTFIAMPCCSHHHLRQYVIISCHTPTTHLFQHLSRRSVPDTCTHQ